MNWGQVLGGTVMGLGAGVAEQGKMDILEKRQAVREALAERLQTQRLQYQEGRQDARIQAQLDAQDRRSEDAAKLQKQRDDAAAERTRMSSEATVEAAKIRKSSTGERKGLGGRQFQDENGILWFQPNDGSAPHKVTDESGNPIKGKPDRPGTAAASRDARDTKLYVETAMKLANPDNLVGETPDWEKGAKYLESKGLKVEAEALRSNIPTATPSEPAKPGILDSLKAQAIQAGEQAQPGFGGSMATAQQPPAAAGATQYPRLARGDKAKFDALPPGAMFYDPDGNLRVKPGAGMR